MVDYPVVILSGAAFVYNRQKNLMAYAAIGGVSNVILDFILIPRFGIAGSAWATLAAQILSNVYLWNALKGVSNFSVFCHLKKVIGATVIMAVAAEAFSLLHVNVVIGVLLSAGVYFAILALLKEPFIEEIKLAIRPAPQQATE